MTTSGQLQPGLAGREIVVRYTPSQGDEQPFERTVTTDAKGNWSDSVVPSQDPGGFIRQSRGAGEWLIEPRYEGDADHWDTTGPSCKVTVLNNS